MTTIPNIEESTLVSENEAEALSPSKCLKLLELSTLRRGESIIGILKSVFQNTEIRTQKELTDVLVSLYGLIFSSPYASDSNKVWENVVDKYSQILIFMVKKSLCDRSQVVVALSSSLNGHDLSSVWIKMVMRQLRLVVCLANTIIQSRPLASEVVKDAVLFVNRIDSISSSSASSIDRTEELSDVRLIACALLQGIISHCYDTLMWNESIYKYIDEWDLLSFNNVENVVPSGAFIFNDLNIRASQMEDRWKMHGYEGWRRRSLAYRRVMESVAILDTLDILGVDDWDELSSDIIGPTPKAGKEISEELMYCMFTLLEWAMVEPFRGLQRVVIVTNLLKSRPTYFLCPIIAAWLCRDGSSSQGSTSASSSAEHESEIVLNDDTVVEERLFATIHLLTSLQMIRAISHEQLFHRMIAIGVITGTSLMSQLPSSWIRRVLINLPCLSSTAYTSERKHRDNVVYGSMAEIEKHNLNLDKVSSSICKLIDENCKDDVDDLFDENDIAVSSTKARDLMGEFKSSLYYDRHIICRRVQSHLVTLLKGAIDGFGSGDNPSQELPVSIPSVAAISLVFSLLKLSGHSDAISIFGVQLASAMQLLCRFNSSLTIYAVRSLLFLANEYSSRRDLITFAISPFTKSLFKSISSFLTELCSTDWSFFLLAGWAKSMCKVVFKMEISPIKNDFSSTLENCVEKTRKPLNNPRYLPEPQLARYVQELSKRGGERTLLIEVLKEIDNSNDKHTSILRFCRRVCTLHPDMIVHWTATVLQLCTADSAEVRRMWEGKGAYNERNSNSPLVANTIAILHSLGCIHDSLLWGILEKIKALSLSSDVAVNKHAFAFCSNLLLALYTRRHNGDDTGFFSSHKFLLLASQLCIPLEKLWTLLIEIHELANRKYKSQIRSNALRSLLSALMDCDWVGSVYAFKSRSDFKTLLKLEGSEQKVCDKLTKYVNYWKWMLDGKLLDRLHHSVPFWSKSRPSFETCIPLLHHALITKMRLEAVEMSNSEDLHNSWLKKLSKTFLEAMKDVQMAKRKNRTDELDPVIEFWAMIDSFLFAVDEIMMDPHQTKKKMCCPLSLRMRFSSLIISKILEYANHLKWKRVNFYMAQLGAFSTIDGCFTALERSNCMARKNDRWGDDHPQEYSKEEVEQIMKELQKMASATKQILSRAVDVASRKLVTLKHASDPDPRQALLLLVPLIGRFYDIIKGSKELRDKEEWIVILAQSLVVIDRDRCINLFTDVHDMLLGLILTFPREEMSRLSELREKFNGFAEIFPLDQKSSEEVIICKRPALKPRAPRLFKMHKMKRDIDTGKPLIRILTNQYRIPGSTFTGRTEIIRRKLITLTMSVERVVVFFATGLELMKALGGNPFNTSMDFDYGYHHLFVGSRRVPAKKEYWSDLLRRLMPHTHHIRAYIIPSSAMIGDEWPPKKLRNLFAAPSESLSYGSETTMPIENMYVIEEDYQNEFENRSRDGESPRSHHTTDNNNFSESIDIRTPKRRRTAGPKGYKGEHCEGKSMHLDDSDNVTTEPLMYSASLTSASLNTAINSLSEEPTEAAFSREYNADRCAEMPFFWQTFQPQNRLSDVYVTNQCEGFSYDASIENDVVAPCNVSLSFEDQPSYYPTSYNLTTDPLNLCQRFVPVTSRTPLVCSQSSESRNSSHTPIPSFSYPDLSNGGPVLSSCSYEKDIQYGQPSDVSPSHFYPYPSFYNTNVPVHAGFGCQIEENEDIGPQSVVSKVENEPDEESRCELTEL